MNYQLFVDLDEVLAAYNEGFKRQFGCTALELEAAGGQIWGAIGSVPDFYEKLDVLPGAMDFWTALRMLHPHPVVLTSAGETYFQQCARSKLKWVRKHLGDDVLFVAVKGGQRKAAYAQRHTDVLIDDWHLNCKAWSKAGGTAILHKDPLDSLEELMGFTEKLHDQRY